jgi:hypothetical protein
MLGSVPNMVFCAGYTNASRTLRADLSSLFVCRLWRAIDDGTLVFSKGGQREMTSVRGVIGCPNNCDYFRQRMPSLSA